MQGMLLLGKRISFRETFFSTEEHGTALYLSQTLSGVVTEVELKLLRSRSKCRVKATKLTSGRQ